MPNVHISFIGGNSRCAFTFAYVSQYQIVRTAVYYNSLKCKVDFVLKNHNHKKIVFSDGDFFRKRVYHFPRK